MKRILAFALLALATLSVSTAASADNGCRNCGRIVNIETVSGHRSSTGGAVAGAIIGGAVGNQVGKGDGRQLATVAGVVGGAYVGKEIAENSDKTKYRVTVKMQDGRVLVRTQSSVRNLGVGSEVRVQNGRVRLR